METVEFLLCTCIKTRESLWNLFLEYSLLINYLIQEVISDNRFEDWRKQGKITRQVLKEFCEKAKETLLVFWWKWFCKIQTDQQTDDRPLKAEVLDLWFISLVDHLVCQRAILPSRFYTSAILLVSYTFNSWFEVQKKLRLKISGKERWLQVVTQDLLLSENTDFSPEAILLRAEEILAQVEAELEQKKLEGNSHSKMSFLFKELGTEENELDPLDFRAIAHLLKNSCQVNREEEDPDQLALRLEKKKVEIERLKERLESRLPQGRDVLGQYSEEAINRAIALPEDENFDAWEQALSNHTADLSRQWKTLPYPLLFGSTDDLYWSWEESEQTPVVQEADRQKPKRRRTRKRRKKSKRRITVRFKGKGLSQFRFSVYCDRRQHPVAEQFCTNYSTYKSLKDEKRFSLGLFALRSARLLWKEDRQNLNKKGFWELQNLFLKWFCCLNRGSSKPQPDLLNQDIANPELELWWAGLFYLKLSTVLPWKTHRLYLQCTYDPRLLTAEGTEQVRQEKIAQAQQSLEKMKCATSGGLVDLPSIEEHGSEEVEKKQKNRQAAIKHLKTTLRRLKNNPPPPRPSQVPFQRDLQITVGVCFTLEKIVGVAVVDQRVPLQQNSPEPLEYLDLRGLLTNHDLQVLEKRSQKIGEKFKRPQEKQGSEPKSVLKLGRKGRRRSKPKGKRSVLQLQLQDYRLVNRWRRVREKNLAQRSEEQKRGLYVQSKEESRLSEYLNRLIAKRIVELCCKWKAASIVVPNFANLRESIECEIQAKARKLFCEDNVTLQKEHLKEVRMNINRWNHRSLSSCISSCAAKYGITVKTGYQPKEATRKAKAVALATANSSASPDTLVA
jgi:IS605 OrfB family transposase